MNLLRKKISDPWIKEQVKRAVRKRSVTPKAKAEINKWHYVKSNSFGSAKVTINQMEMQP